MYIKKSINDNGNYDISIEEDNKLLKIYRSGNDTSLSCRYNNFKNFIVISFVIKKEHTYLFSIFENLYRNLIDLNDSTDKEEKEFWKNYTPWMNEIVSPNGITIWDEPIILTSNVLRIQKKEDKIILYFINYNKEKERRKEKENKSISIHIINGHSRLKKFALPFHNLFEELQDLPNTRIKKENISLLNKNKNK